MIFIEHIKECIKQCDFIDLIGGVVHVAVVDCDGKKKKFPIDCSDGAECEDDLIDLSPNSKYNSVSFFEDLGTKTAKSIKGDRFTTKLRFICWLNGKNFEDDCNLGCMAQLNIYRVLRKCKIKDDTIGAFNIRNIEMPIKSNALFRNYTFNEHCTQYLTKPYDYFALDLTIDWSIGCLDEKIKLKEGC